jgi:hypothetical protein
MPERTVWSRRFLVVGLLTGFLTAAAALGGIWFVLYAASGFNTVSLANAVAFGPPGIAVYPICWAIMIYRVRDYSPRRTFFLIAVTYTATTALVIGFYFLGFFYFVGQAFVLAMTNPDAWRLAILSLTGPFIFAFFAFIVAAVVGIAYVAIATPLGFLHRLLMLWLFNSRTNPASGSQQTGPVATGP